MGSFAMHICQVKCTCAIHDATHASMYKWCVHVCVSGVDMYVCMYVYVCGLA